MKQATLAGLYLFAASTALHAQPAWDWAQAAGAGGVDRATAICADGSGNFYLTGWFTSTGMVLGGTDLDNTQTNNSADLFLAKVTAQGDFLWVQQLGGTGSQASLAVAATAQGQVVLAGTFENSMAVGAVVLQSNGGSNVFVAQYTAAGVPMWATSMGGDAQDLVNDVAVDAAGNVAVVGSYYSATFTADATSVQNSEPGDADLFVARLDAFGTVQWLRSGGGTYDDVAQSVATDANGNVVVGGFFACATLQLGGFALPNPNDNFNDLFLAKYDADGTVLWARRAGGTRHERIWGVGVHWNGDIAVAGSFVDATLDLDGTVLVNTTDDQSWYDAFVARYSAEGELLWARADGGVYDEFVRDLAVDDQGNTFVVGEFDSPAPVFDGTTLTHVEDYDAFVVNYGPDGTVLWGQSAGGDDGEHSMGVAPGPAGAVAMVGYFNSDPLLLGALELGNNGDNDLWIAQLGSTVGVSEQGAPALVRAYPTVGHGEVLLQADRPMTEVMVVDAQGRTMRQYAANSSTLQLHLDAPGLYTLRVRCASTSEVLRVMVLR